MTDLEKSYPCAKRKKGDSTNNPTPAKRIELVTLKMVRESSMLYDQRKISSPLDAQLLVRSLLEDADREMFVTVCLDTKHQPTHISVTSVGSLNSSITHPREIFKTCILSNAAALICAHNHPSGDPTPSQEDIDITKRLVSAGKILGVELLDHIIIGSGSRYTSLREQGVIPS